MTNTTAQQDTLVRIANLAERPAFDRVRLWGTEIEHPRAGQFAYLLGRQTDVYECKDDPTVQHATDNKCKCHQCEHDCNCRECHRRNSRCQNSYTNELATSPSNFTAPADLLELIGNLTETPEDYSEWFCNYCETELDEEYCPNCDDSHDVGETGSNWGFHTHIDSRDLNIRQVGSVVRLATYAMKQWGSAFGADTDGYNSHATEQEIERIQLEGFTHSRASVNAQGILNWLAKPEADREDPALSSPRVRDKATIEFRNFRATSNGILHLSRVAFARSVVDYIAEGKPVFYLLRETDLEKFLTELEIWKH